MPLVLVIRIGGIFYLEVLMTLAATVFTILIILIFLSISMTAVLFWIKADFNKIKDSNVHWSRKAFVYYGIFFTIFIVSAIFISFVVWFAIFVNNVAV